MVNNRKQKISVIEVSSPEELRDHLLDNKNVARLVILTIHGPQVIVRPFIYTKIAFKELRKNIEIEAVGLFSLPLEDIEIDFNVYKQGSEITGIFIAMPKKLLKEYISVLDGARKIPLKIVPYVAVSIDSFFREQKENSERVCFIDLSKEKNLSFALLRGHRFEMIRDIAFEGFDELNREILQSLRSSYASSKEKNIEQIYLYGTSNIKEHLKVGIKETINAQINDLEHLDVQGSLNPENGLSLNFANTFEVPLNVRQLVIKLLSVVLCVLCMVIVGLGMLHQRTLFKVKKVKSSYSISDYNYAVDLRLKLESLK